MTTGWLTSACGLHVEHQPCPRPGGMVNERIVGQGVLHTIEGSLESGLAVFHQHYAPHFAVAGGRIVQLVPLGFMAAALEHVGNPPTNEWARVQIEVAAYSKTRPYRFDAATEETLAHLLAALALLQVVQLHRPFPDAIQAPQPWATVDFPRRHAGKWGVIPGWYGHIDVPRNEHWDPGEYRYNPLLQRANQVKAAHGQHAKPRKLPAKGTRLAALRHRMFSAGAGAFPHPE